MRPPPSCSQILSAGPAFDFRDCSRPVLSRLLGNGGSFRNRARGNASPKGLEVRNWCRSVSRPISRSLVTRYRNVGTRNRKRLRPPECCEPRRSESRRPIHQRSSQLGTFLTDIQTQVQLSPCVTPGSLTSHRS